MAAQILETRETDTSFEFRVWGDDSRSVPSPRKPSG